MWSTRGKYKKQKKTKAEVRKRGAKAPPYHGLSGPLRKSRKILTWRVRILLFLSSRSLWRWKWRWQTCERASWAEVLTKSSVLTFLTHIARSSGLFLASFSCLHHWEAGFLALTTKGILQTPPEQACFIHVFVPAQSLGHSVNIYWFYIILWKQLLVPERVIKDTLGKVKYNCGTDLTIVSNPKDSSGCDAWTLTSWFQGGCCSSRHHTLTVHFQSKKWRGVAEAVSHSSCWILISFYQKENIFPQLTLPRWVS